MSFLMNLKMPNNCIVFRNGEINMVMCPKMGAGRGIWDEKVYQISPKFNHLRQQQQQQKDSKTYIISYSFWRSGTREELSQVVWLLKSQLSCHLLKAWLRLWGQPTFRCIHQAVVTRPPFFTFYFYNLL